MYGDRYGTPNDFKLDKISRWTNKPKPIPKNPNMYPAII